jgi:O-antigen/teichoic acid export membrane protein
MTLDRWRSWLRGLARARLVSDTLVLQGGQLVAIAVQGLTSLALLRLLGPEAIGLYALSVAMAALAAILDLTASNRVVLIELSRALGSGAPGAVRDALAGHLRISVFVRGAIVAVFFAIAPVAATLIYGRSDVGRWAGWLAVPLVSDIPFNLLVVALQARRWMVRLVRLESTRAILSSAASVAVLLGGLGISGLVLVQVVVSVVVTAWSVRAYARLAGSDTGLPGWREIVGRARTMPLGDRIRQGISLALEKNVSNLGGYLPILMMGTLRPEALGHFNAAVRVMSLPFPLVSALARNLDGELAFRWSQGGPQAVQQTFTRATLYAGSIWLLVTAAMAVAGPFVLVLVGGPEYAPGVPALYPLILQSLAVGAGVGIGATLRAIERANYLIALQVLSVALTIPLGWELIEGLGAAGGSWFLAIRYVILTVAGIALVRALLRRALRS